MKLSKAERAALKAAYGGMCAYCGHPLGDRWHADHVKPVERELRYVKPGRGQVGRMVPTGRLLRPENDTRSNLLPACVPCNIDKHASSLEGWRGRLQQLVQVLVDNHSAYRHASRFGLVSARPDQRVEFYFERVNREAEQQPRRHRAL